MNDSIIICGPRGCGKTRHAEALRRHFGLSCVVEMDEAPTRGLAYKGALILTNDDAAAMAMGDARGLQVYPFRRAAELAGIPA